MAIFREDPTIAPFEARTFQLARGEYWRTWNIHLPLISVQLPVGLLPGDLCPPCWDVILLYLRLDWSLALASRTTELCQTGASQPEWARTRVASPGFELMVATRLCSGAQPYHLTVPDRGIIAGMGQDQSGLPRIQTQGGDKALTPYCCPPRIFGSGQLYHRTVPDGDITAEMGQDQSSLPRIRTHGGDKALTPYCCPPGTIWYTFMLWCPTVPPNCARRGHHSRNGPDSAESYGAICLFGP